MLWIPGVNGLVGKTLSSRVKGAVGTGREVDISDLEACRKFCREKGPFTHIVNCAAFSQVDLAETKREEAWASNALGPENLAVVAREMGARLIHLSSDYVFGGSGRELLREEDRAEPCNAYGESKLEGERRALAANPSCCILRTSWVFGGEGKNFVSKLLEMLETKEELRLVEDQVGRPTYVMDLVEVILELVERSGVYHFANAGPTNKYEFSVAFREMAESMGFPIRCRTIVPALSSEFSAYAKRPLYSALDTGKVEKLIPFPVRHWKECIRDYLCAKTR